jgi:hypothetical protein
VQRQSCLADPGRPAQHDDPALVTARPAGQCGKLGLPAGEGPRSRRNLERDRQGLTCCWPLVHVHVSHGVCLQYRPMRATRQFVARQSPAVVASVCHSSLAPIAVLLTCVHSYSRSKRFQCDNS